MDTNELLTLFRELASEIAEKDCSNIPADAQVTQLGIDSLGLMELVGTLERELAIRLPEAELAEVRTISDLLGVAAQQLSARRTG